MCDLLVKHDADADHVTAVRSSITGLRVRPEELGAASDMPFRERPVEFEAVEPCATRVMECLRSTCPL